MQGRTDGSQTAGRGRASGGYRANITRRRQPQKTRPQTSATAKAQQIEASQDAERLEEFRHAIGEHGASEVDGRRKDSVEQETISRQNIGTSGQVHSGRSGSNESTLTLYESPDLNLLPVENNVLNKGKFEYYINSFITSILEVPPQDVGRYPQMIHQALHDPMLFTAYTTTSEASRWRMVSLTRDPPPSVVQGYGKTLALLQERLSSQQFAFTNVVLMTMAQLAAVETMIKNVSATGRHLAGMQSIMAQRAKAAAPSTAGPIVQVVNVWSEYFKFREIAMQMFPPSRVPVYPKHPFGPDLNIQIAKLPIGFMDVALSGQISEQLLDMLEGFTDYFNNLTQLIKNNVVDSPERTRLIIQEANIVITFVQNGKLNAVEQILCAGLMAHIVRRDRIHPSLMNLRNYFQLFCGFLTNSLTKDKTNLPINQSHHDNELMKWVGAILLLTSTPTAQARKLALKLLPKTPRPAQILKACEKFFWDETLSQMLLAGTSATFQTSNDSVANTIANEAGEKMR